MAYWISSLDDVPTNGAFRKIRAALEVTAFGVNALVLAPGTVARPHYHDTQDELYFVHSGRARFDFPGESHEVGAGGLVHVQSTTPRQLSNPGDEDVVVLIVGANDGYVPRDGHLADTSALGSD